MTSDILAAVDIGSNAVRLLINYVEVAGDRYECKKAAYLRVPIRLGEDVFTCRAVGEAKAARLTEAMVGFRHIMRAFDVAELRACATSAVREAVNGEALIATVAKASGISIEIISGEEEAALIYTAGAQATTGASGTALYLDVGGGSTELVLYEEGEPRLHESFRVGTVRTLSYAAGGDAEAGRAEQERLALCLRGIHTRYRPIRVIGSGGNVNTIKRILEKKDGEPIRPEECKTLLDALAPLSLAERMRNFGLNDYRADVIVPALEILLRISAACPSIRDIYVPDAGLADGLIHAMCRERMAAGIY